MGGGSWRWPTCSLRPAGNSCIARGPILSQVASGPDNSTAAMGLQGRWTATIHPATPPQHRSCQPPDLPTLLAQRLWKLLGGHRGLRPQGAMAPVFASIDVKICQEFHSLLVKIHCQGLWLPSRELCDLTGPSCSHPHPTPVAGILEGGALSCPGGAPPPTCQVGHSGSPGPGGPLACFRDF